MPLSNAQFGGSDSYSSMANTPNVDVPMSLSKNTYGSAAQATAWRNRSLGSGSPMSLSSKTAGTTFNWDDTASTPTVPQSDKGMGRNG